MLRERFREERNLLAVLADEEVVQCGGDVWAVIPPKKWRCGWSRGGGTDFEEYRSPSISWFQFVQGSPQLGAGAEIAGKHREEGARECRVDDVLQV
jgi:hypothetical protein